MMRNKTIVPQMLMFVVVVGIGGCFSSNSDDINAFLKPDQVDVTLDRYVLQPPDEIEVHCTNVPELNMQRHRVRPDGKVSFEALGEFDAAGKTPQQLAEELGKKVAKLYNLVGDKPIEVRVVAYLSQAYYVMGQVYVPGRKLYTGRDSVFGALADARPNPMAWIERIQVIRPSADEGVDPKIFEVNLKRMMVHGELDKNVLLNEGDIIYVPPTILASIALKIEEVIRPIARAFSGIYVVEGGGDRYVGGSGGGRSY
ncbi:MAG: polysaccharide biosynthesis/export family protein [Planctomycetes bacterium]|nr:polysaccharide biosynthesis/export family protein [Planctomycetota bacterium]